MTRYLDYCWPNSITADRFNLINGGWILKEQEENGFGNVVRPATEEEIKAHGDILDPLKRYFIEEVTQ